jgi:hypothetical protein
MPSAMSTRSDRFGRGSGGGRVPIPATRAADAANDTAFTPNGAAAATTNSQAPSGFAANWWSTVNVAPSHALAVGSRSAGTRAGTKADDAVSASVSPVPSTKKIA